MNRSMGFMLWLGLCLASVDHCWANWQVWTVTETRRVLRDEPVGAAAETRLTLARNQWRGFQILMRCGTLTIHC